MGDSQTSAMFRLKAAVHWVRAKIAPNRLIAEFNISCYGVAR